MQPIWARSGTIAFGMLDPGSFEAYARLSMSQERPGTTQNNPPRTWLRMIFCIIQVTHVRQGWTAKVSMSRS